MFVGAPGTGKTMLAKAIAAEADASFFNMSGSDFVELYAGVGARRVRKLFKKAMRNRPALIFIDEMDAIGGKRNDSQHEESRQTINALLVAMDGFKDKTGVVVIGATNRVEDLDPALLRPGRFDQARHQRQTCDLKGACQWQAHHGTRGIFGGARHIHLWNDRS